MSSSDATTASNGYEPDTEDDDYEAADYDSGDELEPDDDLDWVDEEDER